MCITMLSRLCSKQIGLRRTTSRTAPVLLRCAASLSSHQDKASVANFHDAWRFRVYDYERQRSYALDLGHFFQDRASGQTSALSFLRVDHAAGRPRTAKPQLKGLLYSATEESSLRGPITAYATPLNLILEDNGYALSVSAEDSSASFKFETTDAAYQGRKPSGRIARLLEQGEDSLNVQLMKADATYRFDDAAGNHEQGSAKLFVQRVWGSLVAPASVTCLGHSFDAEGNTWASLQVNTSQRGFQVRFLSQDLKDARAWDFSSSNPDHSIQSEVEADYGKLKLTLCDTATGDKLVIQGSAPHRTFDLWALPTLQGFSEKGIQSFNGTVTVTATSHSTVPEAVIMEGVNLQFGAAYAAKVVGRMTGTQFSSPLRYKGKGITR